MLLIGAILTHLSNAKCMRTSLGHGADRNIAWSRLAMSTRELSGALQETVNGLAVQDSLYVSIPISKAKSLVREDADIDIRKEAPARRHIDWAQIKPAELQAIISGFSNPDPLWGNGLHICGLKYVLTKAEGRSLYGRKVSCSQDTRKSVNWQKSANLFHRREMVSSSSRPSKQSLLDTTTSTW